jgi:haloalkane dehalogenase
MNSSLRAVPSDPSRVSNLIGPLARPPWLSVSDWPFATGALEVEGARLAVTDVGEGPALLFVHTGLWSFVWRDAIGRLSADFRCVAFDAPGTGRSERLPRSEITLERAARAVTAVIEALELRDLTLVFHDLGGPVSIAGAAALPDRIRGLAAVNTFAWKPSGAMFTTMLRLMGSAPLREFDARTGFLLRVAASSFGVGRHLDGHSRAAFRAGIGADGLRTFHQYMRDARIADSVYRETSAALAGPFKSLPLLTIFGQRNDPLGFQPRWKQMFPDARQVVVPKGNHFPMCDDADLVADAIRLWHRERVEVARG